MLIERDHPDALALPAFRKALFWTKSLVRCYERLKADLLLINIATAAAYSNAKTEFVDDYASAPWRQERSSL